MHEVSIREMAISLRAEAKPNNPDCQTPGPPDATWIAIPDRTKAGLLLGIIYFCPEHWRDERACWSVYLGPVFANTEPPA